MERNVISEINNGLQTAFFECNTDSNLAYRPQFITNDHKRGIKVLTHIENQLMHCDEFSISVAFISRSGFVELSETLKELERRGIKGRILTTDYLHFSDPYALDRLAALKNVELKMYHVDEAGVGFHTKGYLFRENGIYRIIIGSSNMTQTALSTNMEWNTQLVSTEQGEMAQSIVKEFEMLWTDDVSYTYEEFSEVYRKEYKHKKQIDRLVREQQKIALQEEIIDYDAYKLKPNKMQEEFICSVHDLIERGAKKALLISATGTGKTYASAFAMRNEKPKKALFIVHRELIARQALKSYKKVFGSTKKLALLSGNSKEYDADILFATMSMMAKTETLERYKVDEFDWICIDEVHRAGSESYQKIMNYFQPDFWLGMTASPERTDGFDIFNLFDHNIAYEIRLQHALKEDLLCPFHYFGITDIEIDGETVDDKTDLRNFSYLVSDTRARYILEQANYFGHSGERVKGLIFCSGKKEAQELSTKFNEYGYYTTVLTGANSEKEREKAINLLTREVSTDEIEKHEKDICNHVKNDTDEMPFLDYIFTIDIFNEGVDIPEINQVLMLRPTESPIVFVQQLGRGLRKAEGKEYVVIIDFIGNYTNNYMIPIALSGDRSYNKDSIRRYVSEGTRIIPGASTIHFDEISRKRIFQSIDSARTNDVKLLRESFEQLKYRLGRIPSILDFRKYGSIDVNKYFVKFDSYYALVRKVNVDRYDDREIIKTNLIESYNQLLEFGRKNLPDKFFLEGVVNKSLRNTIVREMVSNTLMHREFTSSYTAKFVIEKDRMYVENANRAAKEGVITVDNLDPNPKNPIIAAFFRNIGYADQLGSGVRKLFKYSKYYSGKDPQFVEDDVFRIIVPLDDSYSFDYGTGNGSSNGIETKSADKVPISADKMPINNLTAQQNTIFQFAKEKGKITSRQAEELLEVKQRRARSILGELVNMGILERKGMYKSTVYVLKDGKKNGNG